MDLVNPEKNTFDGKPKDHHQIKWITFILLLIPLILYSVWMLSLKSDLDDNGRRTIETQRAHLNQEKELNIQAFELIRTRFHSQLDHLVNKFNKI